jgi:hypothetical protein
MSRLPLKRKGGNEDKPLAPGRDDARVLSVGALAELSRKVNGN